MSITTKESEDNLSKLGLLARRRALGDGVFVRARDQNRDMLVAGDWSVSELRAMADYMETHRDMTVFPDGSGSLVNL